MTQAAGFKWIRWARDRHLKGPAQGILNVIASHANAAGESWPSTETIVLESGSSKSTVQKAIRALAAAGVMNIEQSSGRQPNVYRMQGSQLPLFDLPSPKKPARKRRPQRKPKPVPTGTPASRFYDARGSKDQIAAIIDYLRASGFPCETEEEKNRVAGYVARHKSHRKGRVWNAIVTAIQSKPEGDAMNLAEKVYQHGELQEANRREASSSTRRTATKGEAEAGW